MSFVRLLCWISAFSIALVAFDSAGHQQIHQTSFAESDHISAILILDNSGSMQTSDSNNLRFTGARMFISLMDIGDAVGVITFSTSSHPVTNGLVAIDNENQKASLMALLTPVRADGYTDVKSAFQDAAKMIENASSQQSKPVIIFLTDGVPEIPNPYPTYEQETLDLAKSLNVPIMAIALTRSAQTPFLDQLAVNSGGTVTPAETASDLLDAYLQIFGKIKDRTTVGSGQSVAPCTIPIYIDPALAPYIEKASFVVAGTRDTKSVVRSPDGTEMDSTSPDVLSAVTDDPSFTVLTIQHPAGGNWGVQLDGSGKVIVRAILYSRLRVELVSPGSAFETGKLLPIVVRLTEEKPDGERVKIIGDADFSAVITQPDGSQESLDQFYDDGTHGDATSGDGNYTRVYVDTEQAGEYTLTINGIKGIVPVSQVFHSEGIDFPVLVVDQPAASTEFRGQPLPLQVHLEGGQPSLLDQGNIIAHITSPSGTEQSVILQANGGTYKGTFSPTEPGIYHIRFESDHAMYRGLPYSESIETQTEVKIIRTLMVTPSDKATGKCGSREFHFALDLTLTDLKPEDVTISFKSIGDLTAVPANVLLSQGRNNVDYLLTSNSWFLRGGKYQGIVTITSDSGLDVQPARSIEVNFLVPSPLARCQLEIGWGGIAAALALAIGIAIARQHHLDTLPTLVTGTLRYQPSDGSSVQEIDLTALKKSELCIGYSQNCDVTIQVNGMTEQHAILRAEKTEEGSRIVLQPIGEVRKGYSVARGSFILTHGITFWVAGQEFKYLSDSGE